MKYFQGRFKIKQRGFFNFELTTKLMSESVPVICYLEEDKFKRVINLNAKQILVEVRGNKDYLEVCYFSLKQLNFKDKERLREVIKWIFCANLNLAGFYREMRQERALKPIIQELKGVKIIITPTFFEALVLSIIEQQIAYNVAQTLQTRFIRTFGKPFPYRNRTYYSFPLPEVLAEVPLEKIRKCGVSWKKAEYIKSLAKLITKEKLDLEKLKEEKDTQKIIQELIKLPGVGVWTAELAIVRAMPRYDVTPADDLGLRRAIAQLYFKNRKIVSQEEARRVTEKWSQWKGLVSFYLVMYFRKR